MNVLMSVGAKDATIVIPKRCNLIRKMFSETMTRVDNVKPLEILIAGDGASALDEKTESLGCLAVLAALHLESGIPFHVTLGLHSCESLGSY